MREARSNSITRAVLRKILLRRFPAAMVAAGLVLIFGQTAVAGSAAGDDTSGARNPGVARVASASQDSAPQCPYPFTIFGQPPDLPSDPWSWRTSDADSGWLTFDSFSGLADPIEDVHWWGVDVVWDGSGYIECDEDPMTFNIVFYHDSAGAPGAVACSYTMTVSRAATGLVYSGYVPYDLWEYSVVLPTSCNLSDGWISIEGTGDAAGPCRFGWMSSPTGDGTSLQSNGSIETVERDRALCLTRQPRLEAKWSQLPHGAGEGFDAASDFWWNEPAAMETGAGEVASTPPPDRMLEATPIKVLPVTESQPGEQAAMGDTTAACTLNKAVGTPAVYLSSLLTGDIVVTYYDPDNCGDSPTYPFEIESLDFTLKDFSGAVWPVLVDVVVYDMAGSGDPSGGPGAELCRTSVSADQASFMYPTVGTVSFSPGECCVEGPFYMGLEYTDQGTDYFPSIMFDDTTPTVNDNWFYYYGAWYEWYAIWYPPVPGYPMWSVNGDTNAFDCREAEVKWEQLPDLDPTGMDVSAFSHPTYGPYILADDFFCEVTGPITEIHIWGSWWQDYLPYGTDPTAVTFTLSIHEDIPAGENPHGSYSMPGDLLWIGQPDFVARIHAEGLYEGWFEPPDHYDEYGDSVCWEYIFYIDDPFIQEGTSANPIVYWLDVQADPWDDAAYFGWKTSLYHWNDDAAWTLGVEPLQGGDPPWEWWELRYPLGHPMYPESIDLAFAIYGLVEEPPEVNKVVADDFQSDGRPVKAVRWWGSNFGEVTEEGPCGWFISFHHDDVINPGCPPGLDLGDPHPTALGIYFAPADAVDITPMGYLDCLGHPVYEYEVDLSNCCLLCTEEDPRSSGYYPAQPGEFLEEEDYWYWLDIQAVVGVTWDPPYCEYADRILTEIFPAGEHFWGWHTSPDYNRYTACTGKIYDFSPYPPDCWDYGEWDVPLWECPDPVEPVHMAFELLAEELPPPDPPDPESPPIDKNRYISFVPGNAGRQTALRVTLTSMPAPFTGWNGTQFYVGPEFDTTEQSGSSGSTPTPTFKDANLQVTRYCQDWGAVGPLHVTGHSIVPSAVYDVEVVACATSAFVSLPLTIGTPRWGDVVGDFNTGTNSWTPPDGTVDFKDIAAMVDKFKNITTAPVKARTDLSLSLVDRVIDFVDIADDVDAFKNKPYPYGGPNDGP